MAATNSARRPSWFNRKKYEDQTRKLNVNGGLYQIPTNRDIEAEWRENADNRQKSF